MKITKISSKDDIKAVMLECRDSFYSDTFKTEEKIDELSTKFSTFAEFYVAKNEDKNAGFIAFYCNDMETKKAFLSMIIVKREHQGEGIGKALMSQMETEISKHGFKSLELEVAKTNENAIKFYNKKGFYKMRENDSSLFLKLEI